MTDVPLTDDNEPQSPPPADGTGTKSRAEANAAKRKDTQNAAEKTPPRDKKGKRRAEDSEHSPQTYKSPSAEVKSSSLWDLKVNGSFIVHEVYAYFSRSHENSRQLDFS
jgi:hypothetical protein